jgi:hypothetical protein
MEVSWEHNGRPEPNGYLAGWVAQKATIGQLQDAWTTMLSAYDHDLASATTICAIDEGTLPKKTNDFQPACPSDQEIRVPFPEALALFLVDLGYITKEQSKQLGFDVDAIHAQRAVAMNLATAAYLQKVSQTWFLQTRDGRCMEARQPASPADAISLDRANGFEDAVNVLASDVNNKPIIVRVGKPQPGNMVSMLTFYRGSDNCEKARAEQQQNLQNLK